MKIAIRADASIQMGSGHVMRCLTLANELRERGAEVAFICREHEGHLFGLIESSGHRLFRLPPPTSCADSRLAHAQWLGATQQEDSRQTAKALNEFGYLDCLIIDHYAIDEEWEAVMREHAKRIMVIDDLADREHDCDVLLDQNLQLGEHRYDELVPPGTQKLLGPKYALLRPEFRMSRTRQKARDGKINRILVFFGGGDPSNETSKALRAIQRLDRSDIAVDVVIGSANPHQNQLVELCAQLPGSKLHIQVSNMAELMAEADLAIGAGGGTMWERCCLGLPAIVMSLAENQRAGCEAVARSGSILYLGDAQNVGMELLEGAMRVVISCSGLLASMSEAGKSLVDGQGIARVTKLLTASSIMLRRAEMADCERIFDWRNAEETRRFSIDSTPIAFDEHVAWFKRVLENPDRQILIGESNGEAVGVLRFDRDDKRAVISVYLVPGNYGKGIGARLIELGTSWVEDRWEMVGSIEATIMAGNAPSISAFAKAGFKKKSYTYVKQIRN